MKAQTDSRSIGAHQHVFENAAVYRRAVDERLFQLGPRRYDALMDTLIQLRQPQLSRRPDESSLSHALTEALPPLAQELLADVADAMNQLEEDRRQLEHFQQLHAAVLHFDARYRAYAGVLSRRQARELRQAQTEFDNASRERNDANLALASSQSSERMASEAHAATDIGLKGHRMRLDTLLSDPAVQAANRLDQAERDAQARKRDFAAAENDLRTARESLERETELLRDRQRRSDDAASTLGSRRVETVHLGSQIGLENECASEPLVCQQIDALATFKEQQFASGVRRLHEGAARRRKDLALLRQRLRERTEAQQKCELLLHALQEKREEAEGAAERRAEADAAVESEAQSHVDAWAVHLSELRHLRVDSEPIVPALLEWALRLEGDHPARRALLHAQQETSTRMGARQAALNAQKISLNDERESLLGERLRLLAGVDAEPPIPLTRGTGTRSGITGAPLWKLVDFRDAVDPRERAGLEAALEASGLLDAWVTPDGRLLSVDASSPWLDAQWVRRDPNRRFPPA